MQNLHSLFDLFHRAIKLLSARKQNSRLGRSFWSAARLTKPAEEPAARPRPKMPTGFVRAAARFGGPICMPRRLLLDALVNSFFRTRLTAFVAFNVCYEQRSSCGDVFLSSSAALNVLAFRGAWLLLVTYFYPSARRITQGDEQNNVRRVRRTGKQPEYRLPP